MALKITDDVHYQDIADAIRTKLQSADTYLPSEMADAIESISGGSEEEQKTLFIDYDGTVLYQYTADEIGELAAMPVLPTHQGLTCQGWNWTLEAIKAMERHVVVGATYITDDGKTRVYITVPAEDKKIYTKFNQSAANGVKVWWGDGEFSTSSNTSVSLNHTYANAGDYVVCFEVISGTLTFSGDESYGSKIIYSNNGTGDDPYGAVHYITKVEFGSNIVINSHALHFAHNCESVTIPLAASISVYMFGANYNLNGLVVPYGVTTVENSFAAGCYGLEYVSLPSTVTAIGNRAFEVCYNLKRIGVADAVTSIGEYAFFECYNMEEYLPVESLTTIGDYAYSKCRKIKDTELDIANISSIGAEAFYHTMLEAVSITSSCTLGASCFEGCAKLETVDISGVTSLGIGVFKECRVLKELELNPLLTAIPDEAFYYCILLEDFDWPTSLTGIGSKAFYYCRSLNEIEFPGALNSVGSYAFENCRSITEVTIPSSVTSIGTYAFNYCYSLLKVTFEGAFNQVNNYVFSHCLTLRNVVFGGNVTKFEGSPFAYSDFILEYDFSASTSIPVLTYTTTIRCVLNKTKIYVPAALYDAWKAADKWTTVKNYIVAV